MKNSKMPRAQRVGEDQKALKMHDGSKIVIKDSLLPQHSINAAGKIKQVFAKMRIVIKEENIKDILDWFKTLITLCSAAVGALLFKFEGATTTIDALIKGAAMCFVLALMFLLFSAVGVIEHRGNSSGETRWLLSVFIWMGIMSFLGGFACMVVRIII